MLVRLPHNGAQAVFCPAHEFELRELTDGEKSMDMLAMDYIVELDRMEDTSLSQPAVLEYFAERFTLARQARLRTKAARHEYRFFAQAYIEATFQHADGRALVPAACADGGTFESLQLSSGSEYKVEAQLYEDYVDWRCERVAGKVAVTDYMGPTSSACHPATSPSCKGPGS